MWVPGRGRSLKILPLPAEGVVKDRKMGATHHPGFVVVLCLCAYFDELHPSYAPARIFALPENTFHPFKTPSSREKEKSHQAPTILCSGP